MPVEIKQLIIRASVEENVTAAAPDASATAGDRDTLIQDCVKQVLRILKKEKER